MKFMKGDENMHRLTRHANIDFDQAIAAVKNYVLRMADCASASELLRDLASNVVVDNPDLAGNTTALLQALMDAVADLVHGVGKIAMQGAQRLKDILIKADNANEFLEQAEDQAVVELIDQADLTDAMALFRSTATAQRRPRLTRR